MTQNMVRRAIALAIAACLAAVALGTPEYYGAGPSPECGPYDVIMLLDASGSIERFQKSQRIAKAIAAQFNIGTEETQDRVTALSFGSTIFKKKHLWQIKTPNAFNKLVNSMEAKEESETNIPYALDSATTMMNARPRDATEVFVLISDGNVNVNTFSNKFVKKVCSNIGNRPAFSQEAMEECFYLQAAEVVDDNDIQLIYVPVGDEPFIPSGADPIEPYLEMPTDLSTPNKIAQSVAELVCETTTPEGCQEGVDIIFVVDASYTIDMDEYNASHVFVLDFASRYAIDGDDGARFGLIEYSTVITQEFSILESDGSLRFPSQADFEAAVNGIDRDITLAENTNTPLALQTALAMIESTSALDAENGREDRPTFVIHVGDNDPNVEWSRGRIPKECANWNKRAKYPKQAAKVCSRKFAQEIQDTSATFVSVLVGGTAAGASLYNPVEPEVQLYEVDDYASLVMVVDEIVDDQCGSGPEEVTPAPTDETPRPTTSPTDSPTTSPTLGPVEVIPGCYKEEQIYRATAANRLETIEDDPGVQTPEQCQATCVENPECNYWSFRADSGNSDGNARAQCNLMAALKNTVSGSARWTSGPRICTQAPTTSPTDSPTGYPTDSPTGFPTDSPTGFPTDSPTGFPTDSPTGYPTDSPTGFPTDSPTGYPTDSPTGFPTDSPTGYPTDSPTGYPTDSPTGFPTDSPTGFPTFAPVDGCPDAELDIVWVVDNSGSIDQNGATGSKQLNDLLPRMIEGYTLTQSETRFAGFRFVGTIVETDGTVDGNNPFGSGPSGDPGSPFFFNEDASTNENGAWVSFGETNDGDGFTNTPQALQAAAHILSLDENEGGPRDDVVKVVVLLTDGNPNRYWGTECGDIPEITGPGGNENVRDPNDVACTEYQAAKLINDYGAYLVVVRIGNNLDSDFMEHCIVQSTPADPNQPPSIKQIESSFEVLQDTIDAIIEATCINTSYINPNPVWYPASAQTCANSV